MHRSGTSLMASLLSALGVDMGRLLPEDPNNRRGYFEDLDFLALQRSILSACCLHEDGGHPDWGWTESESLSSDGFKRFLPEARMLIESRSDQASMWGWKDPRTTLLLDFWDDLIPGARYVLVYRFPWDVADSMQRLGAEVFLRNPEYAYRIWMFYNRRVLDFHAKHSDRCLLVSINALCRTLNRFAGLLADKLGLSTADARLDEILEDDLFKTIEGSDPLIDLVAAVWPDCTRVLAELDGMADLSSSGLWEARPARTRFPRPGANDVIGEPADVSVVIPSWNQGTLLVEAIASVERTATANCQLIIINDGSSQPRTLEILGVLRSIGYFVLDQSNTGLSAARNNGIAIASGRYVLPLDDDNRIVAGFIEEAVKVLDSTPEVGVVYGDRYDFGLRRSVQRIPDLDLDLLLKGNYIDACAVFRKQVWSDCGGYDPAASPVEDWEMWIHAAERGWRFHRIPCVTFEYRVRPGSLLSLVDSADAAEDRRRIIRVKHSELYRASLLKQIDDLSRRLTETENQGAELAVELTMKGDEFTTLQREFERALARLAETDRELHALKSEADLMRGEVGALSQQLADREAEIARIKGTYGWRLLSVYGRIKYRYLLRIYRALGLHSGDQSPGGSLQQ